MTTLDKIRDEVEESITDYILDEEDTNKAIRMGNVLTKVFDIIDRYAEQEPCDDVVSREKAVRCVLSSMFLAEASEKIEQLPSVIPQEQTGHWIGIDEEPHEDYECDKCGYVVSTYTANIEPHTEYKYCPNCGAKMVEAQESKAKNEIHCACTDEEIAKSFIEDVEAVKELLPRESEDKE